MNNFRLALMISGLVVSYSQSYAASQRVAQAVLRTSKAASVYAGRKVVKTVKEHPRECAGAAIGGCVGYEASEGKLSGVALGVSVGLLWTRQSVEIRALKMQLNYALAHAQQTETEVAAALATNRAGLGALHENTQQLQRQVDKLQKYVKNLGRFVKQRTVEEPSALVLTKERIQQAAQDFLKKFKDGVSSVVVRQGIIAGGSFGVYPVPY